MRAWNSLRRTSGHGKVELPTDDLILATIAMANATSWFHVDTCGLGTLIDMLVGSKYWAVCRTSASAPKGRPGNDDSMNCFVGWEPSGDIPANYDVEAVVLNPGTVL
jgi:hypothetical protein